LFSLIAWHKPGKFDIALRSPPDAAKAEVCFERAVALARQQQAKSWELRASMSMARLWREQGKVQQARELLAPVYGWFTEGFDTRDLKEAKGLLEELAAWSRASIMGVRGLALSLRAIVSTRLNILGASQKQDWCTMSGSRPLFAMFLANGLVLPLSESWIRFFCR
jgi:hypothetical protein